MRVARAMTTVMRVVGDKEAMATAAIGMVTATMVAGGDGVMVAVTRVSKGGRRRNGQWQWRQEQW